MSENFENHLDPKASCHEKPCNSIVRVIQSRERDIGDFTVRRVLPYARQRMIGPWIFFDQMGPAKIPAGKGIDVRPHPHINLATVTYLFEGAIMHRDSLGNALEIKPGDINLMVAGKGIVHSERSPQELRKNGHKIHGLQLWLALPTEQEEVDPSFHHYDANELPTLEKGGATIRVLIGEAFDLASPVKQFAKTLYVEARLQKDAELVIPSANEKGIYVVEGAIEIDGATIEQAAMAVLQNDASPTILAKQDTQIAIIGGEPVGERHIKWNFISSRPERIEQAKNDWKKGKFPKVPGDEKEWIPFPD